MMNTNMSLCRTSDSLSYNNHGVASTDREEKG